LGSIARRSPLAERSNKKLGPNEMSATEKGALAYARSEPKNVRLANTPFELQNAKPPPSQAGTSRPFSMSGRVASSPTRISLPCSSSRRPPITLRFSAGSTFNGQAKRYSGISGSDPATAGTEGGAVDAARVG